MPSLRAITIAVILAVFALPLGQAESPPPAPIAAAATQIDDVAALVSWVPAKDTPVGATFNVYGVAGGSYTLLEEGVLTTSAAVPAGYSGYAVSTMSNGQESELTTSISGKCVYVVLHFPFVEIHDCPVVGQVKLVWS